ncbi:MAG: hypothetical protein Q8922_05110 [Bacteroidota bacterium]|nr:hypothetical protein [Bacteroidota bacterium]MDP4231919.1 hypothetical protein [Bacteroidota bacterium]MDP4241374.1 hypothetical protein [Bacteroidota bacterium]MDP4287297.1 hypothetical protein [Bacteroidota bacterium]
MPYRYLALPLSATSLFVSLLVSIVLAPAAQAQTKEETITRLVTMSANNVLDSMMHTLSLRTQDFNAHVSAINKTRPLEATNLDSAHLATNAGLTLEFIEYLKQYRASSKTTIDRFEDSLFILESEFPPVREKRLIKAVAESYMADNKAFDGYVGALSKVYSNVLNILLFLQHTPYSMVKGKPQFRLPKDMVTYQKMLTQTDDAQKEAAEAAAASRDASQRAHKKLREFNTAQSNND